MPVIKVEKLIKKFGDFKAVNNISFNVKKGEIFGLLGPNGAGKTTTIRMLTGILKPTSGQAFVGEYNIQKEPLQARQNMGIVPEMANAYVDLSAIRNLLLMGELYGLDKEKRIERAERLLKLFKLYEYKDKKVKSFSKGMHQRIILAMALMNNSEVLFLDEPTTGLDVESVRLIRKLIKKFNNEETTIILTTHDIEEANLLCDRVAIMNHGEIVAIDRPEELKKIIESTNSIIVAFKEKVAKESIFFKKVDKIEEVGDKYRLYAKNIDKVISLLVEYSNKHNNEIIT
ncbi:MAG: ABC transporter ATP-binding protein, partial [Minisyncoccales bacterium]